MKEKKFKYVEDLLDEYIQLIDEQTDLDLLLEKGQKKLSQNLSSHAGHIYKSSELNDVYKAFFNMKKYEERKNDLKQEVDELENLLKGFLLVLNNGKISYDRKDDNDKSKSTVMFWVENSKVKFERQAE